MKLKKILVTMPDQGSKLKPIGNRQENTAALRQYFVTFGQYLTSKDFVRANEHSPSY